MKKATNVDNPHDLLTVAEVSSYLRIPLPTVYYHAQRGSIPAHRIGGRWRFKRADLDAILGVEQAPKKTKKTKAAKQGVNAEGETVA